MTLINNNPTYQNTELIKLNVSDTRVLMSVYVELIPHSCLMK